MKQTKDGKVKATNPGTHPPLFLQGYVSSLLLSPAYAGTNRVHLVCLNPSVPGKGKLAQRPMPWCIGPELGQAREDRESPCARKGHAVRVQYQRWAISSRQIVHRKGDMRDKELVDSPSKFFQGSDGPQACFSVHQRQKENARTHKGLWNCSTGKCFPSQASRRTQNYLFTSKRAVCVHKQSGPGIWKATARVTPAPHTNLRNQPPAGGRISLILSRRCP